MGMRLPVKRRLLFRYQKRQIATRITYIFNTCVTAILWIGNRRSGCMHNIKRRTFGPSTEETTLSTWGRAQGTLWFVGAFFPLLMNVLFLVDVVACARMCSRHCWMFAHKWIRDVAKMLHLLIHNVKKRRKYTTELRRSYICGKLGCENEIKSRKKAAENHRIRFSCTKPNINPLEGIIPFNNGQPTPIAWISIFSANIYLNEQL